MCPYIQGVLNKNVDRESYEFFVKNGTEKSFTVLRYDASFRRYSRLKIKRFES